jgi:hypothetical protein
MKVKPDGKIRWSRFNAMQRHGLHCSLSEQLCVFVFHDRGGFHGIAVSYVGLVNARRMPAAVAASGWLP